MKRDLDRIREILLQSEAADKSKFNIYSDKFSDFDRYQIELMEQAGFVKITRSENIKFGGPYQSLGLARRVSSPYFEMTYEGHNYLDAIRNEGVWLKTKAVVAEEGGSLALEIVKSLALGFAKKQIEDRTGIKI